MDLAELVWARDPHEGYVQGRIGELLAHEYEVIPLEKSHLKRNCSIDDIFPSCGMKSDHDDNCKLCSHLKKLRNKCISFITF